MFDTHSPLFGVVPNESGLKDNFFYLNPGTLSPNDGPRIALNPLGGIASEPAEFQPMSTFMIIADQGGTPQPIMVGARVENGQLGPLKYFYPELHSLRFRPEDRWKDSSVQPLTMNPASYDLGLVKQPEVPEGLQPPESLLRFLRGRPTRNARPRAPVR